MTKLTDTICRAAKPKIGTIAKLSDGAGLQLWVHPSGSKSWHIAFRVGGKQRNKVLGSYPAVSLKEARAKAAEARAANSEAAQAIRSKTKTFKEVKDEWREQQERSGASSSTLEKGAWLISLTGDLDAKPIADIRAPNILAVLRAIEAKGQLETAARLRSTISRIFRFAAADGLVDADPTALLKGAVLPPQPVNRAAIVDPRGFAKLMKAIDAYEGRGDIVRAGLMLLALTAARPGELRLATWNEFDLDAGIWTVPAGRMKMRLPHRAPLSRQAVDILSSILEQPGNQGLYVFPSERPGRPISEAAFGTALRIMNIPASKHTPHGFRSSFSTLANESGLWRPETVEMALAHIDSTVRGIYQRSDYFEERRRLMQWWADEIDRMLGREIVPAPPHE